MTTLIPTTEQLISFVEENELNIFECYNFDNTDIETSTLDAETYVSDHYEYLVQEWQKEQPCNLSSDQVQIVYDRAFAKLQTLKGQTEFFSYAINVCQRLLNYKMSKINSKYSA